MSPLQKPRRQDLGPNSPLHMRPFGTLLLCLSISLSRNDLMEPDIYKAAALCWTKWLLSPTRPLRLRPHRAPPFPYVAPPRCDQLNPNWDDESESLKRQIRQAPAQPGPEDDLIEIIDTPPSSKASRDTSATLPPAPRPHGRRGANHIPNIPGLIAVVGERGR